MIHSMKAKFNRCGGVRSWAEEVTSLQPEPAPALVGQGDVDGVTFDYAMAG
jgi:hypothetical protein